MADYNVAQNISLAMPWCHGHTHTLYNIVSTFILGWCVVEKEKEEKESNRREGNQRTFHPEHPSSDAHPDPVPVE